MSPTRTDDPKSKTFPQRRAFTVAEFLEHYGISRTRTYVEMNAGRLVARRIGGRTIITRDDAEAWLDSLPKHRPAGPVPHVRCI